MKKYCLVENGKITQVQDEPQDGFILIEADDIQNSMLWDGKILSNPSPSEYVPTKDEQLNNLIVTIASGKRFYADPDSRTDLVDVVLEGIINSMPDDYTTEWKTASRPEGTNFETVTFAELKEAKRLALEAKGQIVGVN